MRLSYMKERTYPYSGLKVKQSDSQKGSTTLLGKIPPTVLPDIAARSTRVDTHVPAISSSRGALHPSQNQATRKGRNTTSYEIFFPTPYVRNVLWCNPLKSQRTIYPT